MILLTLAIGSSLSCSFTSVPPPRFDDNPCVLEDGPPSLSGSPASETLGVRDSSDIDLGDERRDEADEMWPIGGKCGVPSREAGCTSAAERERINGDGTSENDDGLKCMPDASESCDIDIALTPDEAALLSISVPGRAVTVEGRGGQCLANRRRRVWPSTRAVFEMLDASSSSSDGRRASAVGSRVSGLGFRVGVKGYTRGIRSAKQPIRPIEWCATSA